MIAKAIFSGLVALVTVSSALAQTTHDETLIRKDGTKYTGHRASSAEFITCYNARMPIDKNHDVVEPVGSCEAELSQSASIVTAPLIHYLEAHGNSISYVKTLRVSGPYALVTLRVAEQNRQALLRRSADSWQLLTVQAGQIQEKRAADFGVNSDDFGILIRTPNTTRGLKPLIFLPEPSGTPQRQR